jgi:hypothetical protein
MAEQINIQRAISKLQEMNQDLPRLIANDALHHFLDSFRNEGFTDKTLEKWKPRKRLTARDRRRVERLTKKGRSVTSGKTDQGASGRALLVLSGALRRSIKVHNATWTLIRIGTMGISYSGYHNRGEDGFKPIRQYVGESEVLNEKIRKRIRQRVDDFLKSF